MSAIDLTTLENVKAWIDQSGDSDDQTISDCITAFSAYLLRIFGRSSQGSVPATSSLVAAASYDEFYDGNGQDKLYVRNWPVNSIALLAVDGISIPVSTSVTSPGVVVDQSGRAIVLRGGYGSGPARFADLRRSGRGRSGGFALGRQNVELQYNGGFAGTPEDLEMCARKVVGLNYKRTDWIGQRSQMIGNGGGSVFYDSWEMDPGCVRTIEFYRPTIV
jgi:hypothetical protein